MRDFREGATHKVQDKSTPP
jgi:hypothetical protein